jgi:hypothetical protein
LKPTHQGVVVDRSRIDHLGVATHQALLYKEVHHLHETSLEEGYRQALARSGNGTVAGRAHSRGKRGCRGVNWPAPPACNRRRYSSSAGLRGTSRTWLAVNTLTAYILTCLIQMSLPVGGNEVSQQAECVLFITKRKRPSRGII